MNTRKVFFTLGLLMTTTASLFAQGKVQFSNNTTHLAYYDFGSDYGPGTPAYNGNVPFGVTLLADLYIGTSSSLLYLNTSSAFSTTAEGKWNSINYIANGNPATGAPAIPGGSSVWILVQVRDSGTTAANTLSSSDIASGMYSYMGTHGVNAAFGWSQEFNLTLGASVAFPPLWGPAGNWPAGTYDMSAYGDGWQGAIPVYAVPEPSSLALVGLGAVATVIFRRRK